MNIIRVNKQCHIYRDNFTLCRIGLGIIFAEIFFFFSYAGLRYNVSCLCGSDAETEVVSQSSPIDVTARSFHSA